jgi:hypothetical protein
MAIPGDNRKFYINWEAADRITELSLLDQYEYLTSEVKEIEALDEIPEHKAADLGYNISMLKALKKVLGHYGVTVQ